MKFLNLVFMVLFFQVAVANAQEESAGGPEGMTETEKSRIAIDRIMQPTATGSVDELSKTARPCSAKYGTATTAFDGMNCGFSDIGVPNIANGTFPATVHFDSKAAAIFD